MNNEFSFNQKSNKAPRSALAKRMIIMLIIIGVLFGCIVAYKIIGAIMFEKYMKSNVQPPVTVSSIIVKYSPWQPKIVTVGSVNAINGVDVTTQIAGLVQEIKFKPGSQVKSGDVLVQLNADTDIAQLTSLQAAANLSKITYDRDKAQYAIQAISKATLDSDEADLKSKLAQVDQQIDVVAHKTIRAPFSGRLGINAINLGQYINPGDKIVTLQSLDPIYFNFYVPQQQLVQLKMNEPVQLSNDSYPGKTFTGKITTIEPKVDPNTRNVEVEATIGNPQQELLPGMFATINVNSGSPQNYLTVPQAAISYNPYGDIVYIVKSAGTDKAGKPVLKVEQSFVTLGDTRGDQIQILTGLNEGDQVVTSGQMKLKNGSTVLINNSTIPGNNPSPTPVDE